MTRPPIEFLLHPPSPKRTFTLPPVSLLLSDVTHSLSSSPICQHDLPSIPSLRLPDKEYPSLMLSIPYNDPASDYSSPACSPLLSYQSLDTPQSSPVSSPHHPFLLPPPDTLNRSRSHSNASTSSWSSVATSTAVTAPSSPIYVPERRLSDPFMYQQDQHYQQDHYQRPQSASPSLSPFQQQPCPSTSSSSSSSSSDPVVKRKRGRPPNTNRQVQRDHWTFVTPTVWDVKRTQLPEHLEENQQDHHLSSSSPPNSIFSDPSLSPSLSSSSSSSLSSSSTPLHQESAAVGMTSKNGVMLVLWPHDNNNNNNTNTNNMNLSHQNLNTFTNTNMDTTLTMPKKKRGRKPKTQLAGNSCFVWRDLTAKRGANRLKTPPSNNSTQQTSSSPPPPHLLPANRSSNLRINKKQPPHPYAHSHRNHHQRNKTEDDDIIGWTKDLSLNDRPTLSN